MSHGKREEGMTRRITEDILMPKPIFWNSIGKMQGDDFLNMMDAKVQRHSWLLWSQADCNEVGRKRTVGTSQYSYRENGKSKVHSWKKMKSHERSCFAEWPWAVPLLTLSKVEARGSCRDKWRKLLLFIFAQGGGNYFTMRHPRWRVIGCLIHGGPMVYDCRWDRHSSNLYIRTSMKAWPFSRNEVETGHWRGSCIFKSTRNHKGQK